MLIANPVYDVVFTYLFEESSEAKTLISAIIAEDIAEIEFRPEEPIRAIDTDAEKKRKTGKTQV